MTIFAVLLLAAASASAQSKENYGPKAGDWSVGININPVAAGGIKYQPGKGDFVGGFLTSYSDNPAQMYIPGQSLVSIKAKKMISDSFAVKATLGFSGSYIDYNEYVKDDYAASMNSATEEVVSDHILGNLASASATLGVQKYLGKGRLRFTVGADLSYTIAGGTLNFKYGNDYETYNYFKPSTMSLMEPGGSLNLLTGSKLGITYARPATRNEIGTIQQIGLVANAGLEFFLASNISAGVELAFIPVAFTWQSQTWGIYEGYSTYTQSVLTYNQLVSDGSKAITYGTNNFAVNLSINYYF